MYRYEKNDIYKKYINVFKTLSKKIESPNLLLRYSSYFQSWWECPLLENDDFDEELDYQIVNQRKFDYRKQIYFELKKEYGKNVYIQLLSAMSDDSAWGYFLLQIDSELNKRELANKCVESSKYQILLYILNSSTLDEFSEIFTTYSEDLKIRLLPSITRNDILDLLDNEEKERAYWGKRLMHQYDEMVYKKLLQYNPMGLVQYYSCNDIGTDNVEDVIGVLKRLNELNIDVSQVQNGCYKIEKLFNKLDKMIYSDDIAVLEFEFYHRHQVENFLEGMRKYYFFNPHRIVEQLSDENDKHQSYFELAYKYSLPLIAYEDFGKYEFFFEKLINCATDKDYAYGIVGQILGRSIIGKDKIFPHEFARKIIEKYANEKLNRDFLIGKLNNDGAHMRLVGDGSDQIAIAQKLKNDANAICIQFPITAQLLQELSEEHISEASMDRVWSEIDLD